MNTELKEKELKSFNTDYEVGSLDETPQSTRTYTGWHNIKYFISGILFGIILIKSEVISWFRIQEMFHLQSFHMYGVIGSAIFTGIISVWIIRKFNIKNIYGDPIVIYPKKFSKGTIYGGLLFGFGWALTGACPGPLFAQIGIGATVTIVTLLSAIAGTWIYGLVREKLPH